MNDDIAIKIENVTKTFKLPHEKRTSVKSIFVNLFRRQTYERQKVLDDVSFDIKKGEFFGIVGRNGSGKSTLLKIMSSIYFSTSGSVVVDGSLTPFIELGVGFNPELTGRENVFLNGALLGFTRKEMFSMYDEIVEFAELERFMDQKLKNYSSGMQVRLAFSIAIRSKSEILVLDEVLAVGDANFQNKCFDYFNTIKNTNKTVVLVTHDMNMIERFCDKALLLEKGKINSIGKPTDIASLYLLNTDNKTTSETKAKINESTGIELLSAELNKQDTIYTSKDKIKFKIKYRLSKKIKYQLGVAIIKNGISIYERNTKDINLPTKLGKHSIEWEASAKWLGSGLYQINIAAFTDKDFRLIAFINEADKFMVEKVNNSSGLINIESTWNDVK